MVQLMPLHPKTPSSLASFKSRLVLLFRVVLKKRPLNGCGGVNFTHAQTDEQPDNIMLPAPSIGLMEAEENENAFYGGCKRDTARNCCCGPVTWGHCCWAPGARRCRSISPAQQQTRRTPLHPAASASQHGAAATIAGMSPLSGGR